MPVEHDPITQIVNVQWGGDVIVVFMEVSAFDPQPVFDLTSIEDKATFLGTWNTPSFSTDPAPFKNTAYKAKSNAGEFLISISPELPAGMENINGTWLHVLVFAEDDLEKIKTATELMAPALYIVNAANADLPSEVAPPGLLWGVQTGAMPKDVTMRWKIRFGNHRDPDISPPPPPNAMVQCYPTNDSHPGLIGDVKVTYIGYYLTAYRLDKDGTDQVYSESPKITDVSGTQNLPPQWATTIVPEYPFPSPGIPFADPPPMIDRDEI